MPDLACACGGGSRRYFGICILSDKCINLQKPGKRWEVALVAKRTDPENDLEHSVPIKWGECYDEADHDLLTAADEENGAYQALVNDHLVATQQACVDMHEGTSWVNVKCNPFHQDYQLDWAIVETPNVKCYLKDVYESSCPQPENASGTTAGMTTGPEPTTTEPAPTTTEPEPTTTGGLGCGSLELANWITCSGSTCVVSQELIDTLEAEPTLVFCDSARLYPKIESSEVIGMYFDGVRPAGLAGMLGFLDDDVILAVEGLPFTHEEEFAAVAAEIVNADAITVTIRRGTSTIERDFERD